MRDHRIQRSVGFSSKTPHQSFDLVLCKSVKNSLHVDSCESKEVICWLLGFTSSAAGSPGIWRAATRAVRPSRNLPLVHRLLLGRLAWQTGAVHDVGIQHLQQEVIQRHHVLHFHAVEMVHALVTAYWEVRKRITDEAGGFSLAQQWVYWSQSCVPYLYNGATKSVYFQKKWTFKHIFSYLAWRICDSNMSRWASRVYCWRKVRPVLAMANTRASVTASRRCSNLERLCSSSLPSEKLRHMPGKTHRQTRLVTQRDNLYFNQNDNFLFSAFLCFSSLTTFDIARFAPPPAPLWNRLFFKGMNTWISQVSRT